MFTIPKPQPQTPLQQPKTLQLLSKQLLTLNTPIEKSSKQLCTQLINLQASMEQKLDECEKLCTAEQLDQLDALYDRAIDLLRGHKRKQEDIIRELRAEGHGRGVGVRALAAKVGQIQYGVKEWMDKMPLVDRIIKIEKQIKKLQQLCDQL